MADFKPILTDNIYVDDTNIPVEQGQLIFAKDTGDIYVDDNTDTRIPLSTYKYYIDNGVRKGIISNDTNVASGEYSYAEGDHTTASGNWSHAEGQNTTASGNHSHAEGYGTTASSYQTHAEGYGTKATQAYAHAEGCATTASGYESHAEGYNTTASYDYAHAEGNRTVASQSAAHAEGYQTTASGNSSHAEGYQTTAKESYSHAEGYNTMAAGYCGHVEGFGTTAGATREDALNNNYTRSYAHAEGYCTVAAGDCSHAEGYGSNSGTGDSLQATKAIANYSHAEGYNSQAYGFTSHVEGYENSTGSSANYSHVGGQRNFTLSSECTVHGSENRILSNSYYLNVSGYANSVKNGSGSLVGGRYNALGFNSVNPSLISGAQDCSIEGYANVIDGQGSHVEGRYNVVEGYYSHIEGTDNILYGNNGHIEGSANRVGRTSLLGTDTGTTVHPTTDRYSSSEKQTIGWKQYEAGATAILVAYGYNSKADNSHAEGYRTSAIGYDSHSSGAVTEAYGDASFTSGAYNKAIGHYSAAFGYGNSATSDTSMVLGQYANTNSVIATSNLFDANSITHSKILGSNGTEGSAQSYDAVTTDYINIENCYEMKLFVRPAQPDYPSNSGVIRACFYDSSNNLLSPLDESYYTFNSYSRLRQYGNQFIDNYTQSTDHVTAYIRVPAEAKKCKLSFSYDSSTDNNTTEIIGYKKPSTSQLFVIGNGSDSTHRSNIVEVDNTSLTINGRIKANALNIDWVAGTSYSIGDVVIQSLHLYRCKTANNDSTFTVANWDQIT